MNRLIALGGNLRAGKDETAQYLAAKHDYALMGMSDPLNAALLKLNPLIPTTLAGPVIGTNIDGYVRYQRLHDAVGYVEAKKNPEVRRLLQVLGTEVGREMIDQDVWVTIAERTIREHWANNRNVVITAVRFPNELEMVRRLGGSLVWIERPSEARTDAESTITAHASETSVHLEDFDYVLDNDSTLEALYSQIEELLPELESVAQSTVLGGRWFKVSPSISTYKRLIR